MTMLKLFNGTKKKTYTIDMSTPLADASYAVFDTELTGLDEKKDSIISIGAVRMAGGRIDLGDTFSQLVSPATEISAKTVVIHEITPSEVVRQPGIDAVLADFIEYCGGDVVVGHFVSIDLAFVNREMKRLYGEPLPNPALDTFTMYEWLRKRSASHACLSAAPGSYRLYDIAKCFGIPVNGAHKALMDAFIAAQLFQRFVPLFIESGIRNIGELLKVGNPFKGGDRFRTSGEIGNL